MIWAVKVKEFFCFTVFRRVLFGNLRRNHNHLAFNQASQSAQVAKMAKMVLMTRVLGAYSRNQNRHRNISCRSLPFEMGSLSSASLGEEVLATTLEACDVGVGAFFVCF